MIIRITPLLLLGVALIIRPLAGQAVPDRMIIAQGVLQTGFELGLANFENEGATASATDNQSTFAIRYPGRSKPGVAFITAGPAVRANTPGDNGPSIRNGEDLHGYQGLVIEMYADRPGSVSVGIKSAQQDKFDYGFETKILVNLSQNAQQYYFPLSWFQGTDLNKVYLVTEFVFDPNIAQTLHVRTIRYTADGYATAKVLPHLAFGGGWSTSLYFTNTSGAATEFPVKFIASDGTALGIPSSGSSSMVTGLMVTLPARGMALVELPNQGPLVQGYATMDLQADVSGYALLRQTVVGQLEQQSIVPFNGAKALTTTLAWNEADSVTTVAIANLHKVEATVNIVVYDEAGKTLGTSSIKLLENNKTALVLRNLPGLAAMAGKRGSVDFTISTGNLAVLGLRFVGAAFTAIPAVDK